MNPDRPGDIAIIGGGASGLVAAIAARRAGASVVLLERNPRVGKKLLTTGNHQCNLTNLNILPEHYHGDPDLALAIIGKFDPARTLEFFMELGLETIADERGRVYPRSFQAASVLDVLRFESERLEVETLTDADVTDLKAAGDGFRIAFKDGRSLKAEKVILCAGGRAAPATGSDGSGFLFAHALGHALIEPFPALVQLKLNGGLHKAMEGMKWEAEASLRIDGRVRATVRDDILFTAYGLSGTAVLKVSRIAVEALRAGHRAEIGLNLLPELGEAKLSEMIHRRIGTRPERPLEEFFTGWLNKRIGQTLVKSLGFERGRPWSSLQEEETRRIMESVGGWRFEVAGDTGWPNAQVTAGGVDTHEVDPESLESRRVPGLFFAGEILNVDGDSGGYNLQWAWASGWTAGSAAGSRPK